MAKKGKKNDDEAPEEFDASELINPPPELHVEDGFELHAADGVVVLDSHGEQRFTRDEWLGFVQSCQAAAMAVS